MNPRKDTYVGLFVHTWHDLDKQRRVMGEQPYAPGGWWWAFRPAFAGGDVRQYTWNNPKMVDGAIDDFVTLGVDFVFLDFTNGTHRENLEGAHALVDRLQARGEGPRVVFWIEKPEHVREFEPFYAKYDADVFFRLDGKPLLLVRGDNQPFKSGLLSKFTVRPMWGLLGDTKKDVWSFKETRPGRTVVRDGRVEQMGVAFASQATYMTDSSNRKCRDGGAFFESQTAAVRKARPRIVTLCSYNELMAINTGTASKPVFTDAYGAECSADIIPMHGGHGDRYLVQARDFVRSLNR